MFSESGSAVEVLAVTWYAQVSLGFVSSRLCPFPVRQYVPRVKLLVLSPCFTVCGQLGLEHKFQQKCPTYLSLCPSVCFPLVYVILIRCNFLVKPAFQSAECIFLQRVIGCRTATS